MDDENKEGGIQGGDDRKHIIRLENVWKIYTMGKVEVPALKGLSLDIHPQEFLAVMGPSGSGKSTSLNMIGCLDTPTRGHIYLDGKDIAKLHESDLAQIRGRKIGFIFQQFNLMPGLTALENVTLPMIFQGVNEYARESRARRLLDSVNLGGRVNHKPTELSGGEQQRVAIARSLANDPDVILADEPTGNLDSNTGKEIMNMLTELHVEKGKTIIMVTHDSNVAKYAERVVYLKDGRIAEEHGEEIHNHQKTKREETKKKK